MTDTVLHILYVHSNELTNFSDESPMMTLKGVSDGRMFVCLSVIFVWYFMVFVWYYIHTDHVFSSFLLCCNASAFVICAIKNYLLTYLLSLLCRPS